MSATSVCSTALLKSTEGTAAKVIGRCKAKSPKVVLWGPLNIESIADFLWYKGVQTCNVLTALSMYFENIIKHLPISSSRLQLVSIQHSSHTLQDGCASQEQPTESISTWIEILDPHFRG